MEALDMLLLERSEQKARFSFDSLEGIVLIRSKDFTVFATLLPHESREHLVQHNIHVFNADVTNDEDTSALKKQVEEATQGRLDVLVNNA